MDFVDEMNMQVVNIFCWRFRLFCWF